MKLLLIRHADPDYRVDGLTEVGRAEAELLAERIAPMEITEYYVSTMGRAKLTAAPTRARAGRSAVECDWLREFSVPVPRPDRAGIGDGLSDVPWDWLPQDWSSDPLLLDHARWWEHEVFKAKQIGQAYQRVIREFDRVLAEHGYRREAGYYRAERSNTDTLAFFCHFGTACVLMSHLMNVSPMILWHGTAFAPTSVTTIYTEERRPGIASFRASAIGDISHLSMHGVQPSFSARFCETYGNGDRID